MQFDQGALLEGIRRWVEIESPTDRPDRVNAMMDLVLGELAAIGASVERVPGGASSGDHLLARMPWGGEGPYILVLCHLDTVHPVGTLGALPFRVEGDRAYGPGIADMKGGAHIALKAAARLGEAGGGRLPVRFLFTGDEEVGSLTSRPLIETIGAGAAFALVTEAGRDGGKVVTARKGVARYHLSAKGRAAHAGVAHEKGRSAVLELAHQVIAIEAMTDYARGTTVNVGRMEGGTVINTVPEHAVAHIDVRVSTIEDAQRVDAGLKSLTPHHRDVALTLTGGLNRPPYTKSPAIAALHERARALAAEIGFDLDDTGTGGGSDGSFLAATVPTLDGLGVNGALAHTLEEHLFVSSLVPRAQLLYRLMETLE